MQTTKSWSWLQRRTRPGASRARQHFKCCCGVTTGHVVGQAPALSGDGGRNVHSGGLRVPHCGVRVFPCRDAASGASCCTWTALMQVAVPAAISSGSGPSWAQLPFIISGGGSGAEVSATMRPRVIFDSGVSAARCLDAPREHETGDDR